VRRSRLRAYLVATCVLAFVGSSASACVIIAGLEAPASPPPPVADAATEDGPPLPDLPPDAGATCDPCVTAIAAGFRHTCVAIRDQPPRCWGDNSLGQLGVPDASPETRGVPHALDLPPAALVGAGGFRNEDHSFSCATTADGALHCWGDNANGQLGRGAGGFSATPVAVAAGPGVTYLGVGGAHVCTVHFGGELKCWGHGQNGQIGRVIASDPTPKIVALPRPARAVATGGFHTCVLLDDGTVQCFGLNNVRQLGHDGTNTAIPATVQGLGPVKHLALGWAHSCAVLEDGTMQCWGYDDHGQLGQGKVGASATFPGPVHLPAGRSALMGCAGQVHSCALLDDATVACWGSNRRGQVGTGTVLSDTVADPPIVLTPTVVEGVTNVRSIACGFAHTCALHESGRVTCWGTNESGELGRRTADTRPHPEPAPVVF